MNEPARSSLCKNQRLQQLPQVTEGRKKVEAGVAGLLARMKGSECML